LNINRSRINGNISANFGKSKIADVPITGMFDGMDGFYRKNQTSLNAKAHGY
jgi:hypothetical protein